jgi:hypothetical protein
MSPVIEPTRLSTVLLAWLRLHGEADEHAVPEPVGDTYSVVCTAALASAVLSTPAEATDDSSPATDNHTERFVRAEWALVRGAFSAVKRRADRMIIAASPLSSCSGHT